VGLFCWLLLTLAVYALPFFASVTAGLAAFHSAAGVIGAGSSHAPPRSASDSSLSPWPVRRSSALG
jgi:hypothetical protein